MKMLLFTAAALVALSMLASTVVVAEPTHPNEVGLYTNPDGSGGTGTSVIGSPVSVYLVLTNPEYWGIPRNTITHFECQLNFNSVSDLALISIFFDYDGAVNFGNVDNFNLGYLEFWVGMNPPFIPVVNNSALLAELQFIHYNNAGTVEVTLGPISFPVYEGEMAYDSEEGTLRIMHPVSGSHDAPVFIFGGEAVAVEDKSFGSVKALYR